MQLGLFARTFARPAVEEVFDAVARLHLRCVQFNFACAGLPGLPEAIPGELADRIRGAADERRISIGALSGTFNMIHPNVRLRREGLRKLEVLAGACARLGTRVITLCTGTRDPENMWRAHAENGSTEAWHDLRVSLSRALSTCSAATWCWPTPRNWRPTAIRLASPSAPACWIGIFTSRCCAAWVLAARSSCTVSMKRTPRRASGFCGIRWLRIPRVIFHSRIVRPSAHLISTPLQRGVCAPEGLETVSTVSTRCE